MLSEPVTDILQAIGKAEETDNGWFVTVGNGSAMVTEGKETLQVEEGVGDSDFWVARILNALKGQKVRVKLSPGGPGGPGTMDVGGMVTLAHLDFCRAMMQRVQEGRYPVAYLSLCPDHLEIQNENGEWATIGGQGAIYCVGILKLPLLSIRLAGSGRTIRIASEHAKYTVDVSPIDFLEAAHMALQTL